MKATCECGAVLEIEKIDDQFIVPTCMACWERAKDDGRMEGYNERVDEEQAQKLHDAMNLEDHLN